MDKALKNSLMRLLADKLKRIGIGENELGGKFDLVKSGLVNSLEFVDIVASLEKEFKCEIDFESAIERGELTTLAGLINTFENAKHG